MGGTVCPALDKWAPAAGADRGNTGGEGQLILNTLNNDNKHNLIQTLTSNHNDNDDIDLNPYNSLTIDSQFYNSKSFISRFKDNKQPLFLNLNVQSLNSKYENLKNLILSYTNNNILIELIALQETWTIKHHNLLTIPGFQPLVFKTDSTLIRCA